MTRAPILVCLAAVLLALPARGQTASEAAAAADQLYSDAGALMKANRFAEACQKLETSNRLDPGIGSLIRWGYCLEHELRTASAWSAYNDAATMAAKEHDPRAADAAARAKALEPRLTRLLVVSTGAPPGLEVRRDGKPMEAGLLGTAVPVDPGEHKIEASAPGKQPWTGTAHAEASGGTTRITIPVLLDGVEAPKGAPVPDGSAQRTLGFAAIGVGAAGLLTGAITLGLDAAKHGSLLQQCPMGQCAASLQPLLHGDVNSYHTLGIVSSTSLVAGGALAATGVILLLTAPAVKPQAAGVSPLVGPGYAGLTGRFW